MRSSILRPRPHHPRPQGPSFFSSFRRKRVSRQPHDQKKRRIWERECVHTYAFKTHTFRRVFAYRSHYNDRKRIHLKTLFRLEAFETEPYRVDSEKRRLS